MNIHHGGHSCLIFLKADMQVDCDCSTNIYNFKTNEISNNFLPEAQVVDPKLNEIEVEYHPDCPVCLQSCNYPVQLSCGHIFCYLCIKGVALRSRRCALCRQDITVDSIENPTLVKPVSFEKGKPAKDEGSDHEKDQDFLWYYEGRNGWWQYDEKTATEVEKAFKSGKRSCQLLIAGFLYLIDFENMFQMRRNEPGRRRRIKRDKPGAERKGVAGIRLPVKAKPKSATPSTNTETSEKPNTSSCSSNSNREIEKSSEERGRKTGQRQETPQEVGSNRQEVEGQNQQEVEGSHHQRVTETNTGSAPESPHHGETGTGDNSNKESSISP